MSEESLEEQYTKYEKARILGARALQISANAPILLKMSKEELDKMNYDPIKIAELEFQAGILPITVKRPLPKKIEKKLQEPAEIIEKEKPLPEKEEKPKEEIKAVDDKSGELETADAQKEKSEDAEDNLIEEAVDEIEMTSKAPAKKTEKTEFEKEFEESLED